MSSFTQFIKPNKSGVVDGTWNNLQSIPLYREYLTAKLCFTNIDDWYNLTPKNIKDNYGSALLVKCGSSTITALKFLFPEHTWLPWKMKTTPKGYWDLNAFVEVRNNNDDIVRLGNISKVNGNGTYNIDYDSGEKELKVEKVRVKIIMRPNGRKYADWLFTELGFDTQNMLGLLFEGDNYNELNNLYDITGDMICSNYGDSVLTNIYNGSPIDFITSVYPEYEWVEWKFNRPRQGYWDNEKNHNIFASWLGKQLGYTKPEDWYKISIQQFVDHGGDGLLSKFYNNSPIKFVNCIVKTIYPDYEWIEWKFNRVRKGYWENVENHKTFAIWLGKLYGYTTPEDWYKIKLYMIHDNDGATMVGNYYNDSPQKFVYEVVQTIYPDYTWLPWKFDNAHNNFWKDTNNQKVYADWFGKESGYTAYKDWYGVTLQTIIDNDGRSLVVGYYGGSLYKFLKNVYPEHNWIPWKFKRTSGGAWKDTENQKKALIEFEKKLHFTGPENWYDIDRQTLKNHGLLSMMVNYYNTSLSRMITELFPEYNLKRTKFRHNYSMGSIEWLNYLKVCVPDMRHILNHDDGEFIIPNSTFKADGFSMKDNMIFEYHGDFWHGNPKIHAPSDINTRAKKTYGELYENTLNKQRFCETSGFKFKYIWESEWIRGKNAVIMLQQRFRHCMVAKFKKSTKIYKHVS
jgi:hypothetical protein